MNMQTKPRLGATHVLLLFLVGAVAVLISSGANESFHSSEVAFSDATRQGLSIVPASCASDPHFPGDCACSTYHTLTADGKGYRVPSEGASKAVSRPGVGYCVTNSSGKTYFVPVNSTAEINSFNSAAPGLGGVTVTPI